jgi:secondary thiamine-phosphate synthase enzyme
MMGIRIHTEHAIQALDVTDEVAALEWPDGLLLLRCPHTTAALIVSEADADMLADIEEVARRLLRPFEPFKHHKNDNPNGAAHLLSSLWGTQQLVPVRAGRLELGSYQRLILVELDGPRDRQLDAFEIGGGPVDNPATTEVRR